MKINGIILAAGLSTRMGDFKPLIKIGEKTMIEHSIDSMLYSGVHAIIVVLGYRGEELKSLLLSKYSPDKVRIAFNEHFAETDMLASVKIGIRALPSCDAFFLLPGDMPAISSTTFEKVRLTMQQTGTAIVFPEINGYRKHPPLISVSCIETICEYEGEGGLRKIWEQFSNVISTVPVDDPGCQIDVDTPGDFLTAVNCMKKRPIRR